MRLRVHHLSRYRYSGPVTNSHNEVRLMPVSDVNQTSLQFGITTTPSVRVFSYDLPLGRVHHFNLRAPHRELSLSTEAVVLTHPLNPFDDLATASDPDGFYAKEKTREDYVEYLSPTPHVPLLPETDVLVAQARAEAGPGPLAFLVSLMGVLHREFAYAPGATTVDTPLQQVIESRRGVCQDFTHLMLSLCRRQGVPARYVSGYLFTSGSERLSTPQRASLEEAAERPSLDLTGGDATHAWVECLLPNGQWYGFDPTNNLVATDRYIKVHHGRDYADVSPFRGVYHGPPDHTLEISVRVVSEG